MRRIDEEIGTAAYEALIKEEDPQHTRLMAVCEEINAGTPVDPD